VAAGLLILLLPSLTACGAEATGTPAAAGQARSIGATAPTGMTAPAAAATDTVAPAAADAAQLRAVQPLAASTVAAAEAPPPTLPPAPPAANAFIATAADPLSTFGMDVDTASYTNVRNYLNAGQLPPPALVRAEEFINYFHYPYPAPTNGPFGITVDGAPSPFTAGETQIVRVGIQGRRIDPAQRQDAVLTFVIDVSGSMDQPNRLPLVKDSLRALVQQLRPTDQVAIVIFSNETQVVLDHTSGESRDKMLAAIDSLQIGGATYLEAGLRAGYDLAGRHFKRGAINRVILCSDGEANVGATGPDSILKVIHQYSAQGIDLTTVGFGMSGYNDSMMQQLADQGNGNAAFVDTLQAAQRLFGENLTGTLQVIARDAKIQVDFNPAVVSRYRLLGYEKRAIADGDFRNDKVDAGEVGAGQSVTALYEVVLTGQGTGSALTVQIRYADALTGQVYEAAQPFARTRFISDAAQAAPDWQLAVAAAGFAGWLRGDEPAIPLAQVQTLAARAAAHLANDADVQEFARLVAQAGSLRK
jgi:Ca-activated chloride channel family protein